MSERLVFGVSLSPSEIAEVQRVSADWLTCYQWRRRIPGYQAHGNDPATCAVCRFREPCAQRRDDEVAAKRAWDAAYEAIRRLCISGERRCSDYGFGCHHEPTEAEILESFAEDG